MLAKIYYGNCTRLLKMKNKLKMFFFYINEGRKNSGYFEGVFNQTVIPLSLVGYALIIANSVLHSSLAIYNLISNAHSWKNC